MGFCPITLKRNCCIPALAPSPLHHNCFRLNFLSNFKRTIKSKTRKRTKLSSSSSSSNEDLVEEREELMVFSSENIVSLLDIQTSNTESKKKERKRSKLSLSSASPAIEDLVDEREDFMVFPSENSLPRSSEQTHLLKPFFTTSIGGSEAMLPPRNCSELSPPDLKALSLSVSLMGWRLMNKKLKSWAKKMSDLHKPTWEKAGIFEAVMASMKRIRKNKDLVLGIAEKWCHDTKTFVFPWGEATITLEDVMVLLGFSVLGSPVFATLDSSGEKIKAKLEKEWLIIKNDQVSKVNQAVWMRRFRDSGDELEHVAFLVSWLSYFVFPSRYYEIDEAVFPVAVHLSSGTRIALAPAVLAHLYADLSLLKDHTRAFTISKFIDKIDLSALFKLVQVWTWERFRELQPEPNLLLQEGQLRLALWDNMKQGNIDVRQILKNSNIDSFEWRPYTKPVKNWEFPKFYPERALLVPVSPDLDDEVISFARCIKVSELVGIDCVEHYFPNRVVSQFGLLQDVPCPVNWKNLSKKEAWTDYNKPIEDLTLFIPSRSAIHRVTPMFCEWWKKSFPQLHYSSKEKGIFESSGTLKSRNIIGDDGTSTSGSKRRKRSKRVRENNESTMDHCQKRDNDEEGFSLTIAQFRRLNNKKYSDVPNNGKDASEPLGKKCRFEAVNNDSGPHQKLGSIRADGNENVPPPEIEQKNEENDETGSKTGKNMVMSPIDEINSSDPPLELDVYGGNVENMTMPDDGSKEPECLLHEDGAMVGEKASSDVKEDDVVDDNSLIQKKLALNADNNESTPHQNLASEGPKRDVTSDESNIDIGVGDGTQGHDCLFHDTALVSEETIKSNKQLENLEKRNEDVSESEVGYEKSLHNVKVLALSIEERIIKAQRNVAWLKERKAIKQRKLQQLV